MKGSSRSATDHCSGRLVAAGVACLVGLSACNRDAPSASARSGRLEIVLESDMTIPRDLDHVTLSATQDGHILLQVEQDLGPGALLIPSAFELKATGSASPVTVKAVAYQTGVPRVERDAVTPIPEARVGALRLALNYLCEGSVAVQADGTVGSTCPGGSTCVQGACRTSSVPEPSLPTYDPSSAPSAGGAGGATAAAVADAGAGAGAGCFDVQGCFATAAAIPVDPSGCTAALPLGVDLAGVNVALQFPAGGSGVCGSDACWVVLSGEDWTVSAGALQLPPAVCTSTAARGGTVVLTTACPAKTEAQPNCGAWSSIMMPASQPMTPPPTIIASSCLGPASQACGLCGVQTRTCTNGMWSSWTACTAEGACMPDTTQICGANGTQTCGADCRWGACGCSGGQTSCAGTCTSIDTDIHNCGACGNDCAQLPHVLGGSAACVAGRCQYGCEPGYRDCAGTGQGCPSSLAAPGNCGACGAVCGGDAPVCAPTPATGGTGGSLAACVTGCTDSAPALCDGSCADLSSSNDNCGACGHACTGRATCQKSKCVCPSDTQACGDTCADLQRDSANCGSCGHACPDGSTCTSGVCVCNGAATQSCEKCGTKSRTCVNGSWSGWSDCGGQGMCAAGTTTGCNNGTEVCSSSCQWSACQCSSGFTACAAGACVDLQTSSSNCGKCGAACPQGSTCQNGACTCSGAGAMLCGGVCLDVRSDPANCGACGRACASGVACQAGVCACTPPPPRSCGACAGTQTGVCSPNGTVVWSPCMGAPNLMTDPANCGTCGHACVSGSTCSAGVCTCSGPLTQACGNCNTGTQTRTCNADGSLGAWSACSGGGACSPGATTSCGGGTQTCSSSCAWGTCVCSGGTTLCGPSCVNLANDRLNCGQCGRTCTLSCVQSNCRTVTQLTGNGQYECALMNDGTVMCWGASPAGSSLSPVTVPGLANVSAISAGSGFMCAVVSGGVKCWGDNTSGQLGNGTKTSTTSPVSVSDLSGAVAVSAQYQEACALLSNGTVWCWGQNPNLAGLGDGMTTASTTPVKVSLSGASAIAVGDQHACAIVGGDVQCWGAVVPPARQSNSMIPVSMGLSGVLSISAGGQDCAVFSDGSLSCWGPLVSINGTTVSNNGPVGLSGVTQVSTNFETTCAVLSTGSVSCWGVNDYYELGTGSPTPLASQAPVTVSGLTTAVSVARNSRGACALLSNGAVRCWGFNNVGQIGNGTTGGTSCGSYRCATTPTAASF